MNENYELGEYISNDKKKLNIYNLLYTKLGENLSEWNLAKSKNINEFYDILFDILHISYIYNVKNNANKYNIVNIIGSSITTFLPKNFIYFFEQYSPKHHRIPRSFGLFNLSNLSNEQVSENTVYDEFDIRQSPLNLPRHVTYTEDGNVSAVSFSTDSNDDTASKFSEFSELSELSENSEIKMEHEIKIYLFRKLKLDMTNIKNIKLKLSDIYEYIYFKTCPEILYQLKIDKTQQKKQENKKSVNGFNWEYFIWRKENDEILKTPNTTLEISKDNFYNYNIFINDRYGWNKKQLQTFILNIMIPEFLKQANLSINTSHKLYQQEFFRILNNKNTMALMIRKFFIDKNLKSSILKQIDKAIEKITNKTKLNEILTKLERQQFNKLIENDDYQNIYKMLVRVKYNKKIMNFYLENKIKKISENVRQKYLKSRFKWQTLCKSLTKTTHLQTLRELAIIENIKNPQMMTKRQLCGEFSKKLQKLIDNQKKSPELCSNDRSYLTGETVDEIPSEFFISYKHKNKIFCDDIRYMKKQIDSNEGMHPGFREKLSETTINKINNIYNKLLKTTNKMDDFEEEQEKITPEINMNRKLTTLISKTSGNGYINDQQLFANANLNLFNKFLDKLSDNILSENEKLHINNVNSLIDKKTHLINLLILKIDNDPYQQGNISEIATNLVISYNEIFN